MVAELLDCIEYLAQIWHLGVRWHKGFKPCMLGAVRVHCKRRFSRFNRKVREAILKTSYFYFGTLLRP